MKVALSVACLYVCCVTSLAPRTIRTIYIAHWCTCVTNQHLRSITSAHTRSRHPRGLSPRKCSSRPVMPPHTPSSQVSLFLSVSLSLCVSVALCLCHSVSMSLCVSVTLFVALCLCHPVCQCVCTVCEQKTSSSVCFRYTALNRQHTVVAQGLLLLRKCCADYSLPGVCCMLNRKNAGGKEESRAGAEGRSRGRLESWSGEKHRGGQWAEPENSPADDGPLAVLVRDRPSQSQSQSQSPAESNATPECSTCSARVCVHNR